MTKLTVLQIDALKARDKPYKVLADTGLLLRVSTKGTKSWIVQYVVDRKQHDFPLPEKWGKTSGGGFLSLADARAVAAEIRSLARQGINYKSKIEADRRLALETKLAEENARTQRDAAESTLKKTLGDMFEAWITDGVRREDGNDELRRTFAKDILPKIGGIPIILLTEQNLRGVLHDIVSRGRNRTAVIAFRNLRQMFSWAEKRQPWRKLLSEGSPIHLIEIETIVSEEYDLNNQRDRYLSDLEVQELSRAFWTLKNDYSHSENKRSESQPMKRTTEIAIWIMLGTLCRVGELTLARWCDIDFAKSEWLIPKTNSKGKENNFIVFLSPFVQRMFLELRRESGHTEWCFPNTDGSSHIGVKTITKQIGDRQTKFKKNADGGERGQLRNRARSSNALVLGGGKNGAWTPHDLRRTGATMMQALGISVSSGVIDRCQNHVLPGSRVRRHYLIYQYAEEKRQAWNVLGGHIEKLLKSEADSRGIAV